MKRAIAIIILVPLAVLLVALAVANRHGVVLSLDPFNGDAPAAAITLPLYFIVFASMVLGVLLGGIGTWLGQSRWRRQARRLKREATGVRRENDGYRTVAPTGPSAGLPALRRDAA
ncbi:MAG TPA: LapA family protein [Kaistia sp.]|nr:LapA family protein [Kaistia sp.]